MALQRDSRIDRYTRRIQNFRRDIALEITKSITDNSCYERNYDFIGKLKFISEVNFLRRVYHLNEQTEGSSELAIDDRVCSVGMKRKSEDDHSTTRTKKFKQDHYHIHKYTKHLREELHALIKTLSDPEYKTSYDWLYVAQKEAWSYHPKKSLPSFGNAIHKNPWQYRQYVHLMEPYRQLGRKKDCIKASLMAIHYCEQELQWIANEKKTYTEDVEELDADFSFVMGYKKLFDGINSFFSDALIPACSCIKEATIQDPTNNYALLNLSILYSFSPGGGDLKLQAVKMLRGAIQSVGPAEVELITSFLCHTLSQTYVNLDMIHEALEYLDKSIHANDTMVLAYQDRCKLLKAMEHYEHAMLDSDALVKIKPESSMELSNIYLSRAMLFAKLGKFELVLDWVLQSIKADPTNVFPYTILLNDFIVHNEFDKVKSLMEKIPFSEIEDPTQISTYLQHQAEAYIHFNHVETANNIQRRLDRYLQSWYRIS
ncbi:hypothetical protein AKO1_007448 [Acrasis kona]|uniref:Uncharacterized protein n=1 Tax=Acrasis kona TaxID=1008807 RepID=A0AAW2YQW2_9EUKA